MGLRIYEEVNNVVIISLENKNPILITLKEILEDLVLGARFEVSENGLPSYVLELFEDSVLYQVRPQVLFGISNSSMWPPEPGKINVHYKAPRDYLIRTLC